VLANFHTHTPGSRDYAQDLIPHGDLAPQDVARGILEDCRRQKVHVVAITDHNSPSFARAKTGNGRFAVDPEKESYYAMMRAVIREQPDEYGDILVLPGVEIGAENIHVLGIFAPSDDPGWDVLSIASILSEGHCTPEFYGDHLKSCTDFSVADAIDVIHRRGGIAIPAHIDGASGFLQEEDQNRLLRLIVSRPHLFAVEYLKDAARLGLEELISSTNWKDVVAAREGRSIAWTQSSDAHFVRAFNAGQNGNGKPIGTKERRTWLRLDPHALSFEAVRAALLDPENRVRVDKTRRPRGRQGAYRPLPPDRTYVRAVRLDWGNRQKETLRFNEGINALVGPPRAGKTARAQSFSVASGKRDALSVTDPESVAGGPSNGGPSLRSIDMLLERGVGNSASALWWLHRDTKRRVYAARVEVDGDQLRVHPDAEGHWVDLFPNGEFDRRALRNHFQDLPASQARLAPAVPQAYSLANVQQMLRDPVRVARFIEWHYAPDEYIGRHRKLHEQLRHVTGKPGRLSDAALSAKLKELFTALKESRRKAKAALAALYKDSRVGLTVTWETGSWSRAAERKRVAKQLRAMPPGDPYAVFDVLKSIEDRARLRLKLAPARTSNADAPSPRVRAALTGLLLVIGARDLGPIILDAPGAFFQPAELTQTLAPLLLQARDSGAQFIASIDDTNLPFAVDADLLFVCRRNPIEGRVGPLEAEATGPLENAATAIWALKNLDGGGDQFSRRMQLYMPVLGAALAERQRRLADVVLALGNPKSRKDHGRGK
jgi:histidinol phosphatase-like PHP family hydrolase